MVEFDGWDPLSSSSEEEGEGEGEDKYRSKILVPWWSV